MTTKNYNRRSFIRTASCAAIGSTTLLNSLLNLGLSSSLAANTSNSNEDYRALICILLAGGNDSFNMLVPTNNSSYQQYEITRSNLALPKNSLLNLNYTDMQGQTFGIHPSMPEIQTLFNNGNAAIVSNVGTLLFPMTKDDFINQSVPIPLGLLSHADQIQQWQTSIPQSRSARGWGGRAADILHELHNSSHISMNISLSGTNVFQAGQDSIEYAITNKGNGSVGLHIYEGNEYYQQVLQGGMESLLNQQYADIFKQSFAEKIRNSQENHELFSTALENVSPFQTTFPQYRLGANMHMIARTIAARQELGFTRQTFFVNYGGWDHHDEVIQNQEVMLAELSQSLGAFYSAMDELNLTDNVTSFTISDFARTLTSNGNGSDHAWGGNSLVLGGSVNGSVIYGQYPSLALGSERELGGGVILPSLSADEYFAELSLWLGVSPGDLPYVLPNIGNFYTPGSEYPIGFLNPLTRAL